MSEDLENNKEIRNRELVLLITNAFELAIYSKKFAPESIIEKEFDTGLLTAILHLDRDPKDVEDNPLTIVTHKDITIRLHQIRNFIVFYIFKGLIASADEKFANFCLKIEKTEELVKELENSTDSLTDQSFSILEKFVTECFIEK